MHKSQRGAALIVSLVLLVVALMLGISSMQASLLDERLAGNYRAATQAQMAAEYAVSRNWLSIVNDEALCNDVGAWESLEGRDNWKAKVECHKEDESFVIKGHGCVSNSGCEGDGRDIRRIIEAVVIRGSGFLGLSPITVPAPLDEFDFPNSNSFIVEGELLDDGSRNPAISVSGEEDEGRLEESLEDREDNYKGGVVSPVSESLLSDASLFREFIRLLKEESSVSRDGGLGNGEYGSSEDPMLTYIEDDVEAGGNFSGAGVMVIEGDAEFNGTPSFEGLLIVLGDYKVDGGGGGEFKGSVIIAPYDGGEGGDQSYGEVDLEFSGGGNATYRYDIDALGKAFDLLGKETKRFWNSKNSSRTKPGEPMLDSWREQVALD